MMDSIKTRETVCALTRDLIDAQAKKQSRFMLGLTGAPAAGKSTIAAQLVEEINKQKPGFAVIVPMDGFHYSNEELARRNLVPLKGIPATFDADSFVGLIARIKTDTDKSIPCPKFDRSIEASIEGAIEVAPIHKIVIAEGNYLLLDEKPWNELRNLFDEVWFIDTKMEDLLPRLKARHKAGGKAEPEVKAKIESTDLPNALLVTATKPFANRVISV